MENKPTPDIREFLTKRDITAGDMKSYYVWQQVIEAMQEYAEAYHKEKLRDELLKFYEWEWEDYPDHDTSENDVVNTYLKQK